MLTAEEIETRYGAKDVWFKCALGIAAAAARTHKWDLYTDFPPFESIPWGFFPYNYLFQDFHVLPSEIYKISCYCPNCKTIREFSAQDFSREPCENCSSCLLHGKLNCDELDCNDADAFSVAMNLRFVNSPTMRNGIANTFSGMEQIDGPHIVFRSDVGLVLARIGSRAELSERGWLGEDGLIKQDKKDKILDFASDLVILSMPGMLEDGHETRFVNADSTFYFVAGHVHKHYYDSFLTRCAQGEDDQN